MLDNGKINSLQFAIFVGLITVGDSILVLPTIPAIEAKQDAWLSGILGLAIGLMVVLLHSTVGRLEPNMTLVQFNEKILGKWFGTVASLLFVSYPILTSAATLREIGDFMTTHVMPETPIQAIIILFLGITIMGTRLGLEPMARAAEMLFPLVLLLFLGFVVLLLPEAKLEKMLPVLEGGVKPVLRGSLPVIAFPFLESIVFLMILPYVNEPAKIRKSFLLGALIGGIVLNVTILLTIVVLGPDLAARHIYPSYALARKISVGRFLERVEAIIMVIWVITTYFKVTFYFYAANFGLAQLLKLKEYRMLTLPLGMILVVMALVVAPNITYYNHTIASYWPYYDFTYGLLFPLVLLGVYAVRKRGTK